MTSMDLFGLASQNNNWLAQRQALVAGNVANINTPAYKALDLQPFEAMLESAGLKLAVSEEGHMSPDPASTAATTSDAQGDVGWEVFHSGSNVVIEQELLKAGEVNRAYTLNTNVVKAFHRMLLSSTKVGN